MAVLQLRPTAIPNFNGVSQTLRNAGEALDRGFESAQGLLGSYQAGQQEKADNEVFSEIAALKSQDEINAYLDGNGIAGRNISVGMRDRISALRSGQAALNQTRQQTSNLAAGQAIRNAAEGRTAAEEADRVGARNAARRDAGVVANAGRAAYAGEDAPAFVPGTPSAAPAPTADPQATRLLLARTLQAEAGNQGMQGMLDVGSVIVNRAADGSYGQGIDGVIMRPGQFSAWNSQTGYADGEQGQNMDFTPNAEAFQAADAILGGQVVDQTKGATHYFNPDISNPAWANQGFTRRGDHVFGNANGNAGGDNTTDPRIPNRSAGTAIAAANTPQQAPAQTVLQQTQANNPYLTGPQILAQDAQLRALQEQGRLDRAAARGRVVDEQVAGATLAAATDVNTFNTETGIAAVRGSPVYGTLTNVEKINAVTSAGSVLDGALKDVIAPTTVGDPGVDSAVQVAIDAGNEAIAARPQTQLLALSKKFKGSGSTVTQALMDELQIGQDGEDPSTWLFGWFGENADANELTKVIDEVARQAKVTPSVAAAAMTKIFERDPLGYNVPGARFDVDAAVEYAKTHMGAESLKRYHSDRLANERNQNDFAKSTLLLSQLRTKHVKMDPGAKRDAVAAEIKRLTDTLKGGNTPQQGTRALEKYIGPNGNGMADRLLRLDPASPEFFRAQVQLEEAIRTDQSLSSAEKALLLSTIRG